MNLHQRNNVVPNVYDENVYENYEKPLPEVPTTGKKRIREMFWKNWKASFVLHVIMMLIVSVGVAFSIMTFINYKRSTNEYKSCKELKVAGYSSSGIYKIRQDGGHAEYEVYCDMTSDGGGWTLVASVHEDDIQSRTCLSKDRWTFSSSNRFSKGLWSTSKTIGNLEEVTSDDFKSQAYFMPASDVLISHVPSDIAIEDVEKESFLKYHTYGHFLDKHGSSLQAFYSDFAPLQSPSILGADQIVTSLIQEKGGISDLFSDWYNYTYDTTTDSVHILDKRNNAVNIGNKVSFGVGDLPYRLMSYGKTYTDSKTYHISSAVTYPFVTMATITASDEYISRFRLKVELNAFTSTGDVLWGYGYHGKYRVTGTAVQTVPPNNFANNGTTKPNICRLLFYIHGFVSTANFQFNLPWSSYTGRSLSFQVQVGKNPQNAFVGYMLLLRSNGRSFSNRDISSVLDKVATYASQADILKLNVRASAPQFIFPVQYIKGHVNFSNTNVTSGFLQLRAYDKNGVSYAMCPGVRLSGNANPALYCIGPQSSDFTPCSDFSAWNQLPEHSQIRRTSYKNESFVSDIHSTILIFTR